MNEEFKDLILSTDTDDWLNQLLTEWSLEVQLSKKEADELYERIFVISDDLGYDWWRQLAVGCSFQLWNTFRAI
jgi:hypothetical protein